MKKNREYKKLTKGKFLALGGLLFTLGIITSVTSTYAWYTIREQFTVDNLNISIDMADKAYLKLYLNPDKENIVDTSKSVDELINNHQLLYSETGYTKEELGIKDPLTDVSGMFESDWLNSGTNMKSALPKLHSNYQGKFGNYKNPGYCTDKDVYVQNVFYLESGFDCSVYLDPSSFVRANVEENEKSARIHSREVEELNDVVHTVRVSFFTDEGYIIANPGESNVTYYGSHTNINRIKYDGKKNPYDESINKCEMVNNTSGSVIGYKYFNFRKTYGKDNLQLLLDITKEGVGGTIDVYIDHPNETDGGVKIGTLVVEAQTDKKPVNVSIAVPNLKNYNGKHALFLVFSSPTKEKSICTVNSLQFK